jgi:hypothetical protein
VGLERRTGFFCDVPLVYDETLFQNRSSFDASQLENKGQLQLNLDTDLQTRNLRFYEAVLKLCLRSYLYDVCRTVHQNGPTFAKHCNNVDSHSVRPDTSSPSQARPILHCGQHTAPTG